MQVSKPQLLSELCDIFAELSPRREQQSKSKWHFPRPTIPAPGAPGHPVDAEGPINTSYPGIKMNIKKPVFRV